MVLRVERYPVRVTSSIRNPRAVGKLLVAEVQGAGVVGRGIERVQAIGEALEGRVLHNVQFWTRDGGFLQMQAQAQRVILNMVTLATTGTVHKCRKFCTSKPLGL